ncbi:MAG: helix-turn-helix domain-containing protein [Clostridiales bacterium]|nr:helix-turn-helix domain-containing protein [Clostridiales bacterium]
MAVKEYKFKSALSDKEIRENFNDADLFSGIMEGLEEALAYEKGSAKAATFARKRSLPDVDVAAIRKDLDMTQKEFASVLGVSSRTVEAWESGRSVPTPTAKNLIWLISQDHSLVEKLKISA